MFSRISVDTPLDEYFYWRLSHKKSEISPEFFWQFSLSSLSITRTWTCQFFVIFFPQEVPTPCLSLENSLQFFFLSGLLFYENFSKVVLNESEIRLRDSNFGCDFTHNFVCSNYSLFLCGCITLMYLFDGHNMMMWLHKFFINCCFSSARYVYAHIKSVSCNNIFKSISYRKKFFH